MNRFALIFDLDGVIADTAQFHENAWFSFCKKHNIPITSEQFRNQLFGRSNRETLRILLGKEIPENEFQQMVFEKESLFRELASETLKPINGLVDFLIEAQNHQIPMAVASSAPAVNIHFSLKKTNTDGFFQHLVSSDEITRSKPDPEIFLKAAQKLGFQPADCVVFEDSYAGIEAGLNAGMKVIAVATTHPANELPHYLFIIHDFTRILIADIFKLFSK